MRRFARFFAGLLLLWPTLGSAQTLELPPPARPSLSEATGVHGGALPDATRPGFILSEVRFVMSGSERDAATALFAGVLLRGGDVERVLVRAGVVRAGTPDEGGSPFIWQDSIIVSATRDEPLPLELAVEVPARLPEGLARGSYEMRVQLEDPRELGSTPLLGAITIPVTAENRLGLVLEDMRVVLTSPGTLGNRAVFSGRLTQRGLERQVTLRCGFVRATPRPWENLWVFQRTRQYAAPARERSLNFEIEMEAPAMLHVGIMNEAYLPRVEIVGGNEPPAPADQPAPATAILSSTLEGLALRHWEYTLTAPGLAGNSAVFSGTLENTGPETTAVVVRAGFKPTTASLREGRILDSTHWTWQGEARLSELPPGVPVPFRIEVPVPPKMDLYLRIPSYSPDILLLRPD